MTDDGKKSRAEYFRELRKNNPNRLETANTDGARKREKRGGYKDPYKRWLQSLPQEERALAIELNIDSRDVEGNFRPITDLVSNLENELNRVSATIDVQTLPEVRSKKNFGRLTLTPNTQARRIEELRDYFDRERIAASDNFGDEAIKEWAASKFPELHPEFVLAEIRAKYSEASQRVKARKEKNAKNQRVFRGKNIEKVRVAEKQRTQSRRSQLKEAREHAPFVAIDAEGVNIGASFAIDAADESLSLDLGLPESASDNRNLVVQDHRTFLWGASGDGGHVDWLGGNDKTPLTSAAICDWLVSLPKKFPGAIFVMFAAGYDWTQIFRDMPYEKAWELWNGLPWSEHGNPTGAKANRRRIVLWRDFGLRLYPGKYFEIGRFKDPDRIRNNKGEFDFSAEKIKIYDTFGFFQSSFLKAATGFGGDFLSPEEKAVLEGGKSRRDQFGEIPLQEIMQYTAVELRVLARMIHQMRSGLKASELTLRDWHGAGCIAQTMMKKARVGEFYPEISAAINVDDMTEPLAWALRAFFGGRVEMIKQGVHKPKFWNYDISSAYPHIMRQLPNMKNGNWVIHSTSELLTPSVEEEFDFTTPSELNTTGNEMSSIPMSKFNRSHQDLQQLLGRLENFSLVSMVRVRFHFPPCHRRIVNAGHWIIARDDLPWFPLPIRTNDGAIYFPRYGEGIYMVEEVRAMLRWAMRVYADAKDDERPSIALLEAEQFIPVNDAKPFKALVEKTFKERAVIVDTTNEKIKEWKELGKVGPEPYNVREKTLKLGVNSLYGKTAQSKGGRVLRSADGEMRAFPPKEANPFFAAAVTAGTRAMLLDASCTDLDAIIHFATDGICSIRELPGLEIPPTKTLGTWDESLRQRGVFVKAGIYSHEPYQASGSDHCGEDKLECRPVKRATKMRGIRPASLPQGVTAEQWLIEAVPRAWANDEASLRFPYRAYKTFGAALASRESWKLAGHWIEGERVADIQRVSAKRDCREVARAKMQDGSERPGEKRRSIALFDTAPAENPLGWQLSRPYNPEWIDEELAKRSQAEEEQKMLECKGGFGFERD